MKNPALQAVQWNGALFAPANANWGEMTAFTVLAGKILVIEFISFALNAPYGGGISYLQITTQGQLPISEPGGVLAPSQCDFQLLNQAFPVSGNVSLRLHALPGPVQFRMGVQNFGPLPSADTRLKAGSLIRRPPGGSAFCNS